jgi:chaperonin GroES
MNYDSQNMENQEEVTGQDTDQDQEAGESFDAAFSNKNLAEGMESTKLSKIGDQCATGFSNDLESRSDWETELEEWTNLAKQVREIKSFPWPKASNIKYPLLTTAAMQFAARAYPSLVPSNGQIVNAVVVGKDTQGQKLERATRVSKFMSYQIMYEMDNWEEDMDKMLMMLPVVGTMFKKTWYDKSEDRIRSCLVMPKNLVVNYWTTSLENSERISEIIEMSQRMVKEKQLLGIYRDVDLGEPALPVDHDNDASGHDPDTIPYQLVEQHTFLDLDNDGYAEPYIVTFERTTKEVLRITPRYNQDDVQFVDGSNKKIARIKPTQMYTKFGFVPNPDGSFYDIGFGVLLGPLNESVNTLINLLVDAGVINNLQSGFIGKGLRLRMGDQRFEPGEWKPVNSTGDDLKKQIVPLPTKEPSKVLLDLMQLLITSGKELASVAEIFTGKMPGQNTPATTTMASIEQGMKVFTAVYKRIFRALNQEFNKIFDLNAVYLDPNHYVEVLEDSVGPEDFDRKTCDVEPGADPTAMSQTEKLLKAQGLMELLQSTGPMLDPIKVVSRVLDAQEQPNWQELFSQQVQQTGQMPPPPPDPKVLALQAKQQADQQNVALKAQEQQQQMELESRDRQQQMAMRQQEHEQEMQFKAQEHHQQAVSELQQANVKIATAQAQAKAGLIQKDQQHQQSMQHQEEANKLAQHSASQNSKSGKNTPSRGGSGTR